MHSPIEHEALFKAVMDKRSDVIFAKPLWGYLCSGVVNVTDSNDNNDNDDKDKNNCSKKEEIQHVAHATTPPPSHLSTVSTESQEIPLSIKFFNISRRLYELALPKQSP